MPWIWYYTVYIYETQRKRLFLIVFCCFVLYRVLLFRLLNAPIMFPNQFATQMCLSHAHICSLSLSFPLSRSHRCPISLWENYIHQKYALNCAALRNELYDGIYLTTVWWRCLIPLYKNTTPFTYVLCVCFSVIVCKVEEGERRRINDRKLWAYKLMSSVFCLLLTFFFLSRLFESPQNVCANFKTKHIHSYNQRLAFSLVCFFPFNFTVRARKYHK